MTVTSERAVRVEVPEGAFDGDRPLVAVMRGPFVGSLHRGTLVVADSAGEPVLTIGDADQPVFLRSAAKPFQVLPAVLAGAVEQFGLSERELAVLCASHSAEPRHTDTVLGILSKAGLDESALHCGVHAPLHEATARTRIREGLAPTPVCNNCSGAHAGMLLACRARGWPIDTYGDPDHPLQRETLHILARFTGIDAGAITFATDNCRVPAFRLPIRRAAQAFARLVTGNGIPGDVHTAATRVVQAMIAYPEMVGGEGRFDSDLMAAAGGTIVVKGGAEGFQGIGLRRRGLGLAIKISDGNSRAIAPAVLPVLTAFGALEPGSLPSYAHPSTLDAAGDPVGEVMPIFSLDALGA